MLTYLTIWDQTGPRRTIQDHTGPYGTMGDHTAPLDKKVKVNVKEKQAGAELGQAQVKMI